MWRCGVGSHLACYELRYPHDAALLLHNASECTSMLHALNVSCRHLDFKVPGIGPKV